MKLEHAVRCELLRFTETFLPHRRETCNKKGSLMREFSKVYCSLWQSQKFDSLPSNDAKLFYLYLLTNEHSNSSGCYDMKRGYACVDLGFSEEAYDRTIIDLSIALLIEVEKGFNTILLTNWVHFNEPTNAKHAMGVMEHLKRCSSQTLKTKRAQEFIKIIEKKKLCNDLKSGQALIGLCDLYRYTYPTETETETRPREDLDGDGGENSESLPNGKYAIAKGHGDLPSLAKGVSKKLLQTPLMKRGH